MFAVPQYGLLWATFKGGHHKRRCHSIEGPTEDIRPSLTDGRTVTEVKQRLPFALLKFAEGRNRV